MIDDAGLSTRARLPAWLLVVGCILLSGQCVLLFDEYLRRSGEVGILNFHAHPGPVVLLGGMFWLAHLWIAAATALFARAVWRRATVSTLDAAMFLVVLVLLAAGVVVCWRL